MEQITPWFHAVAEARAERKSKQKKRYLIIKVKLYLDNDSFHIYHDYTLFQFMADCFSFPLVVKLHHWSSVKVLNVYLWHKAWMSERCGWIDMWGQWLMYLQVSAGDAGVKVMRHCPDASWCSNMTPCSTLKWLPCLIVLADDNRTASGLWLFLTNAFAPAWLVASRKRENQQTA